MTLWETIIDIIKDPKLNGYGNYLRLEELITKQDIRHRFTVSGYSIIKKEYPRDLYLSADDCREETAREVIRLCLFFKANDMIEDNIKLEKLNFNIK